MMADELASDPSSRKSTETKKSLQNLRGKETQMVVNFRGS